MESKLVNVCHQLSPGISDFLLIPFAFIGAVIGGAIGSFFEGPAALATLCGGAIGLPALIAYVASRDGCLSDDECRDLLDAAETDEAQLLIRAMYCKKGGLMKSDANRILQWVRNQGHASLQRRMGCAG